MQGRVLRVRMGLCACLLGNRVSITAAKQSTEALRYRDRPTHALQTRPDHRPQTATHVLRTASTASTSAIISAIWVKTQVLVLRLLKPIHYTPSHQPPLPAPILNQPRLSQARWPASLNQIELLLNETAPALVMRPALGRIMAQSPPAV